MQLYGTEHSDAEEFDSKIQVTNSTGTTAQKVVVDERDSLLSVLSDRVQAWLQDLGNLEDLIEIILDLGRPPQARYRDTEEQMDDDDVTEDEINGVISRLSPFGDDNRAGIERTLHRIACMRNRNGVARGRPGTC